MFRKLMTLTVVVASISLVGGTNSAQGHLVYKAKGDTLKAKLEVQTKNLQHVKYVCKNGAGIHKWWSCKAQRWISRELTETRSKLEVRMSPVNAICAVFGPHCQKALSVARCESGYSIYARNGQYLGLFQMGDYARSRYGHAWNALLQARAAYRYFRDAGWGPWECA